MLVLIDAGHNRQTAGKQSQDGSIKEYEYNLKIAATLQRYLTEQGLVSLVIDTDTARNGKTDGEEINKRVKLANMIYEMQDPAIRTVLVSIHLDASDNTNASGMSCWIAPNASSNSKKLALLIDTQARVNQLKGNRALTKLGFSVGNFGIVRDTNMPAVLVECAFMTNAHDQELLKSDDGINKIAKTIMAGIVTYMRQ